MWLLFWNQSGLLWVTKVAIKHPLPLGDAECKILRVKRAPWLQPNVGNSSLITLEPWFRKGIYKFNPDCSFLLPARWTPNNEFLSWTSPEFWANHIILATWEVLSSLAILPFSVCYHMRSLWFTQTNSQAWQIPSSQPGSHQKAPYSLEDLSHRNHPRCCHWSKYWAPRSVFDLKTALSFHFGVL